MVLAKFSDRDNVYLSIYSTLSMRRGRSKTEVEMGKTQRGFLVMIFRADWMTCTYAGN